MSSQPISTPMISRSEIRWVAILTLLVTSLTALPYIYAQVAAPAGYTFGGVMINPEDGNTYLAKIREGYDGDWLYRSVYSPDNEPAILGHNLYLLIGQFARLIQLPIIWAYHLARILAGSLLLVAAYWLAAEITPNIQARRWAWAIAAFGSGLGIVIQLLGLSQNGFVPPDFYQPQSNIFYSILTNPHFPLTTAFEILAVLWVFKPPFAKWPEGLNLGLIVTLGIGLAIMAPYLVPVVILVTGVGLLAAWPVGPKIWVRFGVLGAAMTSIVIIYLWQLNYNPAMAAWLGQVKAVSPPLIQTLFGFGIWLPLALTGAWQVWQSENKSSRHFTIILLAWIVVGLTSMYSPSFTQGRFVSGIFAPIAILAGVGVHWLLNFTQGLRQKLLLLIIVGLGFNSNVIIVGVTFTAPRQKPDTMYLTNDEMAMFDWLDSRTSDADVVLANQRLGNFVPAWTNARVVYGHNLETSQATLRQAEVDAYYQQGADLNLLHKYNVAFVIGGRKPAGWKVAYQNATVTVYSP